MKWNVISIIISFFTNRDFHFWFCNSQVTHACFLLNTDNFIFGPDGWTRRKGAYNWDKVGTKLNGTIHVSPYDLERAIRNQNCWNKSDYSVRILGNNHNCHSFVMECLKMVGAGFFFKDYDQMLMKVFN